MSRPSLSSGPPSSPSPYRYLGRGGGADQPVRLQMVIALVAGLILVAVPLYLWRRPRPERIAAADAAESAAAAGGGNAQVAKLKSFDLPDVHVPPGVSLSPFESLRCESPGPGRTPPEKCDHLPFFEDGLARAIREGFACAPLSKEPYKVSFVLDADFRRKRVNLFVGKSSTISRTKTKDLLKCVRKAMPEPTWADIPHQYVRYRVNVIASYPAMELQAAPVTNAAMP